MSGIVRRNKTRASGVVKAVSGVPSIAGDKSPASAGDMWYNSSTNVLRCYLPVAAWSAGGDMAVVRYGSYGCGTESASLVAGGSDAVSQNWGTTEEYDGSSWSAGGDISSTNVDHIMVGNLTDAIRTAGYTGSFVTTTETYNGTAWSAGTAVTAGYSKSAGFGSSSTSAAICGGHNPTYQDDTYVWNGSSWATEGDLPAPRQSFYACGTTTAGIVMSGFEGTYPAIVETTLEFNGSSWSDSGNDYPLSVAGITVGGVATDCLAACGQTMNPETARAEAYTCDHS